MAAPVYGTDLINISSAEGLSTWTELGASGWQDATKAPVAETDYYIQGAGCISGEMTKVGIASVVYTNSTSSITPPTDGAVLVWQWWGAPASLDTYLNGGQRVVIGSDLSNFYSWDTGGRDFPPNPYGGWKNVAVNHTATVDDTVGSPTTSRNVVGTATKTLAAISKGNPVACDAIRYGRCEAKFTQGAATSSCTFAGFAAVNDSGTNSWGLIQEVGGGYLWKGLIHIGSSDACYFADENVYITVDNTPKVTDGFNKIEVRSTSTVVDWTGVSITALGTVSPGDFEAVTTSATIILNDGTYTDMGYFKFNGASASTGVTWRRCEQVSQLGGGFNSCTFDSPSTGIGFLVNNPQIVTNCDFISDGTTDCGHAMEINTAGSFNFSGNSFFNYRAAATPNAAIYNRSGGSVTLSLAQGDSTPTVRNSTSSDTTIQNAVTVKVTAKDASSLGVITGARVLLKVSTGGDLPYQIPVSIQRVSTYLAEVTHTNHGLASGNKISITGATPNEYNGIFGITLPTTNTYGYYVVNEPVTTATGSPTATYVVLDGLTSDLGYVQDTQFNYTNPQNVEGRVRKGTTTPKYKTTPLTGQITANGFDVTSFMVSDE